MDYNQNCTDCFPDRFDWQHYNEFEELKSASTWLFPHSNQIDRKFDDISLPWILKDYSMNMSIEDCNYMYRPDYWNNDWSYEDRLKHCKERKLFFDQRDCFSSESEELIINQLRQQKSPTIDVSSEIKSENIVTSLNESNDTCDSSSGVEVKDKIPTIPEQHLTFSSPESAFYDYQQKMEKQLCQICKESAAGFHHGAYVCEACKKFFMRHNLNCTKFTIPCPTGGHCAQLKTGRIKCQSCRFKKCINIGMALQNPYNNNSKYDISKIPCRVCGGKSSGFHFGALTCEGCKGFFRRTESTSQQLVCVVGGNNCSLSGPSSRNLCKSCRFKRCIEVGMSKKGSRIGRQPNAVKFHCVLEIMQRTLDHKNCNDESYIECSHQKSSYFRSLRKLHSTSLNRSIKIMDRDLGKFKEKMIVSIDDKLFYSLDEKYAFENAIKEASRIVEVSKANLQDLGNRHYEEKYLVLNDLWNYMMTYFDVHSAMTVQFVKAIPGFNKFELKARRSLVQEAMYPIMLLKLAQDYKAENDEYNYFDFSIADREIILKNFPSFQKITEHLLKISRLVYSLSLSPYALSLMCVVELMKNFQCLSQIEDGRKILDQSKSLLWCCLENEKSGEEKKMVKYNSVNQNLIFLPKKSHQRFEMVFEELPKMLSEMNLEHLKIIQELKDLHPELIFPELYMDMFNIQETEPRGSVVDCL